MKKTLSSLGLAILLAIIPQFASANEPVAKNTQVVEDANTTMTEVAKDVSEAKKEVGQTKEEVKEEVEKKVTQEVEK